MRMKCFFHDGDAQLSCIKSALGRKLMCKSLYLPFSVVEMKWSPNTKILRRLQPAILFISSVH